MQDNPVPLSIEEKLRNWRIHASTLGVAYLALGKLCKTHESRRGSYSAATQAVLAQFSR